MADTPADALGTPDPSGIPPNLAAPPPTGTPTAIPASVAAPAAGTDMPTPMGSIAPSDVPPDPEVATAAVHQNWLSHILDTVGTILGGDKTIVATKHPDGSVSVEHNPSTTGEKWGRIAQAALGGAARGMAVGQGPGGAGRAFATGGLAGLQMPAQQLAAANEEAKNMNAQQLAAANMALTHQGYLSNAELMRERQIKFTQEQADRYNAILKSTRDSPGSEDLGSFVGVTDLPSLKAKYPDAYAAHLGQNDKVLQFDPQIDPKTSQQTGSHITLLSKPLSERTMPAGTPPLTQDYYDSASKSIKSNPIDVSQMTRLEYSTAHQNLTKQNSDLALAVDKDLNKPPTTGEAATVAGTLTAGTPRGDALLQAGKTIAQQERDKAAAGRAPKQPGLIGSGTAAAGTTGDAYLQAAVDPSMWNQVKSIANGDVKMPTAGMRGANQALRNAVMNYDPTYTDARYQTKQNFKDKGDSTSLLGLSTAMEHVERAATNQGFLNPLGSQATAYNKDIQYFSQEAGKLIKGGVLTQGEYEDVKTGLDSNLPYVRKAALDETVNLLGGKVGGIFQKYRAGAGQELPVQEFFDPETQQRLQRFGVTRGAAAPAAAPAAPAAPAATTPAAPAAPTGLVTVQIPGQQPGHIPRSALAQFQHDNPNAKVF